MVVGKLNRRITLQSRVLTVDATGARIETWSELGKVWAEQLNQKQSESVAGNAERNIEDVNFRIRYKSGLASGETRVVYSGRTFDIKGIVEEEIRTSLVLSCKSLTGLEL